MPSRKMYFFGKRMFDVIVSSIALVLLSPVFMMLTIVVWIKLGYPALFVQRRPGLHGVPFSLFKFRTMLNSRDADGNLKSDAERLTRFGRFLRSSSLDELPELVNVLLGQMSFVGPRPLLMDYLPLYSNTQARRHEVRPGITGWAQVNGRNALRWDERFALDVWYVDNASFVLDLKILLLTVKSVVKRTGISAPGEATMGRFTGSHDRSTSSP